MDTIPEGLPDEDGGIEQNPNIESENGNEVDSREDEGEAVSVIAAYDYACSLAQRGQTETLEMQEEYLVGNEVCTANEFDILMLKCITNDIASLGNIIEVVKGQIQYVKDELNFDGDLQESVVNAGLHEMIIELNCKRLDIAQKIQNRRTKGIELALYKIREETKLGEV